MLKKLFIFINLISIQQLSSANVIEVCVKFRDAKIADMGFPCWSKACREKKLPPPPSFYLPTIRITTYCKEGCFLNAKRQFVYRDQTFSEVYESIGWFPIRDGILESEVVSATQIIRLEKYFQWELCMKGFCTTPIPGELIIDYVKGTYETNGDLKKNCNDQPVV